MGKKIFEVLARVLLPVKKGAGFTQACRNYTVDVAAHRSVAYHGRMTSRIIPVVLLLGGCGSAAPGVRPATTADQRPSPTIVPADQSAAPAEPDRDDVGSTDTAAIDDGDPCPPTFEEAKGAPCCEEGEAPPADTCTYTQGECYCGPPPTCSGAEEPPLPPQMWLWVCTAYPPEVRPDGCPGQPPLAGGSCEEQGKVCSYGECATSSYTCIDGEWVFEPPSNPP
jgi:hypothetical protein